MRTHNGGERLVTIEPRVVTIYVDRVSSQWVVRDEEGNLWVLPQTDAPWDDRQLYTPSEDAELELVPGHYKYLLRLPA